MWTTYQEYRDEFLSKGWEPLSEEVWVRSYSKKAEEQKPLFIASKKSKTTKPTLTNHLGHAGKIALNALERAYQMGREDTLKELGNV